MRRAWDLLWLALGGLRQTPLRVALTSLGVAIATGSLVSMVGFALGVQEQVEEPFRRMELFNRIDVMPLPPAKPTAGTSVQPENGLAVLDSTAVTKFATLPGVVLAYPDFRVDNVEVGRGKVTRKVSAAGLPPEAGRVRFVQESLVAGRFFQPAGGQEVILGSKLTRDLEFATPEEAIGQPLRLVVKGLTPGADGRFTFEERRLEVVVAGVWEPPSGRNGFTTDGLALPVDVIQNLPGVGFDSALERLLQGRPSPRQGFGRVVVRVDRPGALIRVERKIQEMGFRTRAFVDQFKDVQRGFLIMDLILTAVGTVALVVAGLGIINTQLMAVLERYREIGIYKALGASDGDVRLLFLAEAALVGLLGGAGGLILGRVVSWVLEVVINAIGRGQGFDQPLMAFSFPFYLLGGAVLFALVMSLVSGVYPAARAARVDPIRALRAE
jgi:putative ABC transport system permease protein